MLDISGCASFMRKKKTRIQKIQGLNQLKLKLIKLVKDGIIR